jgi:hypothetical protein
MTSSVQTVQAQIADKQQFLQQLRAIGAKLAEYMHRFSALREQKANDTLLSQIESA